MITDDELDRAIDHAETSLLLIADVVPTWSSYVPGTDRLDHLAYLEGIANSVWSTVIHDPVLKYQINERAAQHRLSPH